MDEIQALTVLSPEDYDTFSDMIDSYEGSDKTIQLLEADTVFGQEFSI